MWTLKVLSPALWPFLSFSTMSGSPAIARNVGSQSWCWTISFETTPAGNLARPAHQERHAEGAFPVRVLLAAEWRHGAVRPRVHVRTVIGRIHDERVVGDAELVEQVEQLADVLVVVDHGVVIERLVLARPGRGSGLGVGPQMHVGRVDPAEERLAVLVLSLDQVLRRGDELVVARLHALAGERAGVLDLLLADPAPARLLGRVVLVGRPAVQHASRPEPLLEPRVLRIVLVLRVLLGVEVIKVAEELVEAVHRRQELVLVAEMVLAELAGRVAERLEQLRDRRILCLRPTGAPGKPTLERPVRKRSAQ